MENRNKPAPRPAAQGDHKPFNLTKLAVAAGALIAVFSLGYIPSCVSARSAEERNIRLQNNLKLADLRGQLGMASYEANRNNYASAAQHSTEFFNGLRETINNASDATLRQYLEKFLARRDEITTNLSQADPAVKEKLAQAYADFFQITATQLTKDQPR
ncbi:MAG: hypothetical protein AABN33_19140 [Acidobacteriota bacterium]